MKSKLALLAFGLIAGLLALEGALRLGALAVRLSGREQSAGWLTPNRRILALGDSNTYGFLVEPSEAYPKALEREWNAPPNAPPVEVLNVAYPGMNSSQIRAMLPRFAAMFHPDLITVMIGTNDFWTVPQTEADDPGRMARLRNWAWRHVRVYRLLHMLGQAVRKPELQVSDGQPPISAEDRAGLARGDEAARQRVAEQIRRHPGPIGGTAEVQFGDDSLALEWGTQEGGVQDWQKRLAENVAAIVGEARRLGVRLVLVTYPSGNEVYGAANKVVRRTAAAQGVPLVDLEAVFAPRCPQWRCPELFPDQHPTPAGHALAAATIVEELHAQLGW